MSTRIDMIGIFVADLSRMVAFYRDVLGFAITWDGTGRMRSSSTTADVSQCTSGRSCRVVWGKRRAIRPG